MIEALAKPDPEALGGFDTIIDVRTPAEFAEDHIPGAINLAVLSNAERVRVGTMWAQETKFAARRAGAALIARSVAGFLEGPLADKTGGWRPLVYCWRGGQRSGAMAQILSEVGWRVGLLEGGYRTYRRGVVAALYDMPLPFRMFVIAGGTGSGKTDLLERLKKLGVQTLDLEALAHHRGSLFGGRADDPQPSQKMFESRLARALQQLSPHRFVVVEDESSRIGNLFLPSALWAAMAAGPRLELTATPQARARHVVRRYPDLLQDAAQARAAIDALPRHHARETKAQWRALLEAGDFEALACELIELHYDPAYARRDAAVREWPAIDVGDLSDFCLAAAAGRVADIVQSAEAGSLDQHLHEDWRPS